MTSPAALEVVFSEASVGLDVVVVLASDGSLVHHTLLSQAAVLGQGTGGLVSTIATLANNFISVVWLQYLTIVLRDFSLHVW